MKMVAGHFASDIPTMMLSCFVDRRLAGLLRLFAYAALPSGSGCDGFFAAPPVLSLREQLRAGVAKWTCEQ